MWKEGDGDGMSAENLDEVEAMFSVVNLVYIYRTPLAMLKEQGPKLLPTIIAYF